MGGTGAKRFEDLAAWRFCRELARVIFEITQDGPISRDFTFRGDMREAADAAAPLIAEGFKRFTTPEFVHYLRMALGELGELQTQLFAAEDKKYLTAEQLRRVWPLANRATGTTTNLLKSKLRQLEQERRRPKSNRRRPGAP